MPESAPVTLPADGTLAFEPLVVPDLASETAPPVFRTTVAMPQRPEPGPPMRSNAPIDRAMFLAELRAISTAPRCRAHMAIGCPHC